MKFIYMANYVYEPNTLSNNIKVINQEQNKNQDEGFIICGGNQINSNIVITPNEYNAMIKNIEQMNKSIYKFIMYGSLDFEKEEYFKKMLNYSKQSDKNENIFLINHKLINPNTVVIFFNSVLNFGETYINKYLIDSKILNVMSINNLMDYQIKELEKIIKSNINARTLIFIFSTPMIKLNNLTKELEISQNTKFFQFINKYFYLLNGLKLIFVSSHIEKYNEQSTITINKDSSKIIISQYIVGTNNENYSNNENNENGVYKKNIEMNILGLDDKFNFEIYYQIDNISSVEGYLEFDFNEKKFDQININFINSNKIADEKNKKIEIVKNSIIKNNILEPKILENVDLLISSDQNNLSNYGINDDLTEEGDPYKQKYIKYKKKLYKLRNINKNESI